MQWQADYILIDIRKFAGAFINDIVIKSNSLKEHICHLYHVFTHLVECNIALHLDKCFIGYPSATMLCRRVNAFGLSTPKEGLEAIALPEWVSRSKYLGRVYQRLYTQETRFVATYAFNAYRSYAGLEQRFG
jgi:hypothetical protein